MSFQCFSAHLSLQKLWKYFQKFFLLEVELLKCLYKANVITDEGYSRTLYMNSYMLIGAHLESRLGQQHLF